MATDWNSALAPDKVEWRKDSVVFTLGGFDAEGDGIRSGRIVPIRHKRLRGELDGNVAEPSSIALAAAALAQGSRFVPTQASLALRGYSLATSSSAENCRLALSQR